MSASTNENVTTHQGTCYNGTREHGIETRPASQRQALDGLFKDIRKLFMGFVSAGKDAHRPHPASPSSPAP